MAATATAVDFPVSRIESEVVRLRALMEKGQFAAALAGATGLLEEVPENRDVWYIIAVSQRYLRRIPEALATLARLEQLHPDYSRLFQERGHCHVARGRRNRRFERSCAPSTSTPRCTRAGRRSRSCST